MRRAALTLGSTAAGLAALLTFKTHPGTAPAAASAAAEPPPSTAQAAPAAQADQATAAALPPAASSAAKKAGEKAAENNANTGTKAPVATRTVTGAVASTQYGPMQVQLTLTGQNITKVTVLQRTDTGTLSAQIDSMAIPQLTAETLSAQSARIDAVSGATYTSSGYIQSLQSALDKARA